MGWYGRPDAFKKGNKRESTVFGSRAQTAIFGVEGMVVIAIILR
jgi:hypothetical protein